MQIEKSCWIGVCFPERKDCEKEIEGVASAWEICEEWPENRIGEQGLQEPRKMASGHRSAQQQRIIGDYVVLQQIGAGSFAVVWKARHKISGVEVAIKEIATEKLNPKLQESLVSEIGILQRTDHPNIIRLHEIVRGTDRIFLVLEYCAGGDLNAFLQFHGKVSEQTARHIMRQLGAGLQVLRANNLIHRDLKPQNLLLSTNDQHAVLKIADFGFARSLQPQGLAETMCGSPLYMAPEILQRHKYDAKADLWSVGAILFQLVTGRPPFSGNSHVQLLLNITRSTELRFPDSIQLHPDCIDMCKKLLRRNPVERLSFEEFFNHNFIRPTSPELRRNCDSQEECFPFSLDDELQGSGESRLHAGSKPPFFSISPSSSLLRTQAGTAAKFGGGNVSLGTHGISARDRGIGSSMDFTEKSKGGNRHEMIPTLQGTSPNKQLQKSAGSKLPANAAAEDKTQLQETNYGSPHAASLKGGTLVDSMENIEREYVLVNAQHSGTETLSMSLSASSMAQYGGKGVGSPQKSSSPSAPVMVSAISGAPTAVGSLGTGGSPWQGGFQGHLAAGDVLEGPSSHPAIRLHSLQRCARLLTEVATDKLDAGQVLESFVIQLVCLAIWKESLHVCQTWAAAAADGGPAAQDAYGIVHGQHFSEGFHGADQDAAAATACALTERDFLAAVDRAVELSPHVCSLDGFTDLPDAMELIYQAALAVGRAGAVEELMGNVSNAAVAYAKAAALFIFLVREAPYLPLNPPLILSSLDRKRLCRYAESVTTRQNQCTAQKDALQEQQSSF